MRLRSAFRAACLFALVSISWLALSPPDQLPDVAFALSDKLNHIAAFAVLAFLLDFSFPGPGRRMTSETLIKCTALFVYGVCIESAQWYLGYRHFEWADLVADALGVLAYVIIMPAMSHFTVLKSLREHAVTS